MPIFINCSRNSDVWSALSAIGTFLAAFIAIFLAYMPRIKRIDLTFIWSAANDYQPYLILHNRSERYIPLSAIEFYYKSKTNLVGQISFLHDSHYSDVAVLFPHGTQQLSVPVLDALPDAYNSGIFINYDSESTEDDSFLVKLVDTQGKTYLLKEKFSGKKLSELTFGYAFNHQ